MDRLTMKQTLNYHAFGKRQAGLVPVKRFFGQEQKNTDSAVLRGIRACAEERAGDYFMSGREAKLFSSSASVGM